MDKTIKNLLFDLGGVIMTIKRQNCVKALTELGMKDANAFLGEYVQQGPFLEIEEGKLSEQEFYDKMRTLISPDISNETLRDAFNKFLVGIPEFRLDALASLKEKYRIYMLSNTNPVMFNSKIRDCFAIQGKTVEDYFDGIIVSYEAKCVKPNPGIFQYTIDQLGIDPEETLFFDDSQKNLDAAANFGFKTYLVEPGTEFTDYFNKQ